jgi:hypothetical protein
MIHKHPKGRGATRPSCLLAISVVTYHVDEESNSYPVTIPSWDITFKVWSDKKWKEDMRKQIHQETNQCYQIWPIEMKSDIFYANHIGSIVAT